MARRTKQAAQVTRESLLDAAERVFQQRGVSRTALSDIAQAAGVTRGALYWHFKDKAALVNAMMDRVTLPLGAQSESAPAAAGDPLVPLVQHIAGALQQIVHDERTRSVLRIAMQKIEHAEELGPVIDRHIRLHRLNTEHEREVFERAAQQRGHTLPAPSDQLAHGFHGMVHGLIYSWLLDESFDLQATAAVSMHAFLRGIGLELAPPEHVANM
jgi:TetR/AcrR family acrAB operon transcriptional repressor